MPSYLITAPDGRKYRVTGQGSKEEALAHVQQAVGGQGGASFDERFGQGAGAQTGSVTPQAIQEAARSAATPTATMADVGAGAVKNFLPSAQRFGGDMLSIVQHPVETLGNIIKLGAGVGEKLIPGEQPHEVYANALGKFFADRYGGIDNIKKTVANDPVGFAADLATVLTGGEMALARAPGVVGTASRVAGTVGKAIDPVNATVRAVGATGNAIGKGVGHIASTALGVSTGAGGEAIRTAARTGFAGGDAAKAFRANMRGEVPMEDAIASAKAGLASIKDQRQAAYRAGMADLSKDQTVLDFRRIDQALARTRPVKVFKGVSIEPSAQKTAGDIAQVLDQWRRLPAKDFHTAEGLDALKQRLGDLRNGVEPGSASEKLITQVYNIVKGQIVQQAPEYAKTMRSYEEASGLIREIERTLSLNRTATVDTQLRKLQSVLRNGVQTNYGKRADLVKLLEDNGAHNLMAMLAGQTMKSWEPRGLARVAAAGAGGFGILANPGMAVPLAAGIASSSPRLVGEAAHAGGRAVRTLADLGQFISAPAALRAGYQTRSLDDLERKRP